LKIKGADKCASISEEIENEYKMLDSYATNGSVRFGENE